MLTANRTRANEAGIYLYIPVELSVVFPRYLGNEPMCSIYINAGHNDGRLLGSYPRDWGFKSSSCY